jgi:hypothetical protein
VILKQKKSSYLIYLIFLSLLLLSLSLSYQKLEIFKLDFKHKIESYNLGFSSFTNLVEDGAQQLNMSDKLTGLYKRIPEIIQYKFFGKNMEEFEKIYIDIDFKGLQNLMLDRKIALMSNKLSNPSKNSATLTYNKQKFNAKIRLKGHLRDHWFSKYRMSLKIELKKDKKILGLREFSIQKPSSRQYPYDLTFQSMIKDIGILSSNHQFAHIYVNGEDWGIMIIEESVSKEFLEKKGRKNSVIVSFSDEEKWTYTDYIAKNPYLDYKLSDPQLFSHLYNKKLLEDTHNRKVYSYISNNRLANKHIYDTNLFSKAYIMSAIWNNGHPLIYLNSKYYFNPFTLMIEPILSDQGFWYSLPRGFKKNSVNINYSNAFYEKILSNQNYSENLTENLKKIEKIVNQVDKYLLIHQNIFPLDKKKNTKTIKDNLVKITNDKNKYLISPIINADNAITSSIDIIRVENMLLPNKEQASEFPQHLHIRHYSNGNIEIYNLLPDSVVIKSILVDGHLYNKNEIIVPGFSSNLKPLVLKSPYKGIYDDSFLITSEYQGFNKTIKNGITLVPKGIKNPLLRNSANKFNFITQLGEKSYEIKNGNWFVDSPIIIDGDLNISNDTTLNFSESSYLIVKGSLKAIGDKNKPIIFKPVSNSWKGVYVLNASKKSLLKNLKFFNASSLEDDLLKLTGAITFYKSDVDIENTVIIGSKAEDAINIVESIFTINNLSIENAHSDGLDSDFSDGNILNSKFINIGGDALDFSGSKVSLNKINAFNVKDKAVSGGEASILNIQNSNFKNIGVGVASKDGSSILMSNNLITNYKLFAAMSYIKKDFYSSPSLTINNSKSADLKSYIRQFGTSMTVNDIDIPESEIDIEKLYKTNVMSR